MAADGVKESLTVYEMATEHLRKAREVLDRLESASSMASDANDTTEVVSNNIARSLFLCNYIKCGPEPERAQWNGNVERMEHEAGMLQERLDTYMVGQRQIEQGVYLLVGAMNSTGKQKEQVRKKQSDTSVAVQSLFKSSEKKRKKRDPELSCGGRIHTFSKQVTENVWHNNQLELGKKFCEKLWAQHAPQSVTLIGVNSEGEEKRYEVYLLGTRLSKGFSEFINRLNVQPGDFISLDPLCENQLTFCIHRGKELALVGTNPSSHLGQSQAGSMADTFSPQAGHCGTPGLPLSIDVGLPLAITSEVGTFEEALAEFRRSELAQGLEEEVRNEYLAICKHMMCLPHESKTARFNYAMVGIPLMVKVLRQMRTIGIGKEGLTSVKNSLQLLEDYGFECEYLRFVFEKILSVQESFKECEKEEDELRARKVALDQRLRMLQGTL